MVKHFFIVGAPRAATTWLAASLGAHPQAHLSPVKEPYFFAPPVAGELGADAVTDDNLWDEIAKRGHIHNGWIKNPSNYERLLAAPPGKLVTGEATVAYLHAPAAPQAIAGKFPDSHIIVIVREPVDRALSHIRMDTVSGLVRRSAPEILSAEFEASSRPNSTEMRYLGRSLYAAALRRYMDHFDKQRMLVLRFDEVQAAPAAVLLRVATFLGLSAQEFQVPQLDPMNKVYDARWGLFNRVLIDSGIKRWLRKIAPTPVLNIGKRIYYGSPEAERLPESLRQRLNAYFEPDVLETARLTGLNLSSWLYKRQAS